MVRKCKPWWWPAAVLAVKAVVGLAMCTVCYVEYCMLLLVSH